ncbi:ApeA N-terminal domain 1-containing protein [Shewanella baltica]|uniref:ApeA N-terminal domain 1-containing protein n=1 Tax=Shewanella baltica TaxID=62322 RepID=UPI00217D376F|nr:HEPN domain-containing protein [Shewanella baltica]MCS6178223.1 hypothetical protein [Shewanella baltica]MCS6254369.1 hypothetical protein [Shewanella baltica]
MSKKELSFFEEYKFTVKFNLDGDDFTGILSINASRILNLEIHTDNHNLLFEEYRTINSPITCYEIGSHKTFTLHQSELQRGGLITCRYITSGSLLSNDIDQFEVHLTGISTWFERLRITEITDTELKRNTAIDKFLVDFTYKENDYSIENHRYVSSPTTTPTEHLIQIEDCFIIKKKNDKFTLREVENLALEIRNLFSLLLGYSLSIKNLYVFSSNERHEYQSIIFSSIIYEKIPFKYHHDTLCHYNNVSGWGLWETIITNYFKVESFRAIWNRLVVSFSRSRTEIWEYRILSVVVTLEMYCEQESKGKGHKLKRAKFNELRSQLNETLKTFIKSNEFSTDEQLVIDGIESVITSLKNTSHPTLQHKYDFLMSKTSDGIKEAISFSNSDFDVLKKLRNSVAHGLNYKTVIDGEITKEVQLKDRLLVLLMYFVFRELGFSDTQVAQNISNTFNPFIRNADINERARDKLAGTASFITLHKEIDLNEFSFVDYLVINHDSKSDLFTLNEDLSYETKHKWRDSGISDVRDFIRSKLLQDSDFEIEYVNKLYLSSGTDEQCYHGAIMLTHK